MKKKNNITSRDIGNAGEDAVCSYLKLRFYKVIARNYTVKGGELDIVSKRGSLLVFTEVKTRSAKHTELFGRAADSVRAEKIKHLRTAAKKFISDNNFYSYKVRFDVAEVYTNGSKMKINYIKDAFL